jgi:glutamate synthase domain-containing protein 2
MAAAMGGDEYGFGSVAMIATGCVMARICHTNNCPVGVASQVSNDAFSDLNFCNAYGSVNRNYWYF